MRAIVAVLFFVTAAHAALWGVLQDKQRAPDFTGQLPSVSYTPFEPGHVVDKNVDQFRSSGKQVILFPDRLKTGDLIFPFEAARK